MARKRYGDYMIQSSHLLPVSNYKDDIIKLIDGHFINAEKRVDEVCEQYFADVKTVFGRHWRHKKDIPYEIVTPFKYAFDFIAKNFFANNKTGAFPQSGKSQELVQIISEKLLDLPGLESKLSNYVAPYQKRFEQELSNILETIPSLQREKFTDELKLSIDRLQTPVDGARETALFLVAGIVGKVYSGAFSGTFSAGAAVSEVVYISQLSWFGSLWANFFGAPAWVGWVGGIGGLLATLIVAPLLTPFIEIAINRIRAKKILRSSIKGAREKLSGNDSDAFDLAGKTAIYLQFLPDVLDAARKAAGLFR